MIDRLATMEPKIGRALCSFGGCVSPCNTMWLGPRPTIVPSAILIQRFGHNSHGPKIGGCARWGCSWFRFWHSCWAEAYRRTKCHLDPSSHLATTDMGQKLGGYALFGGGLVPHLAQCDMRRGLPPYQVASWSIQPAIWPQQILAKNFGGSRGCAPLGRGAVSPSNTMWPGPRSTCMRSCTLIHVTVWPQYTSVIDRQDRTERHKWSDGIGHSHTIVQKSHRLSLS